MAGAKGRTTVDFGSGATNATVQVTGQTTIADTAEVDAWLVAEATADHSVDEHVIEGPTVIAGAITPGAVPLHAGACVYRPSSRGVGGLGRASPGKPDARPAGGDPAGTD